MSIIHLMRQYDPKSQPGMIDQVLRMGEVSPDSLTTLARQMTIFGPAMKSLHVADRDTFTLAAFMSRIGMAKGRGGSSLQDLVLNGLPALQLTQHAQSGKSKLLKDIGLTDNKGMPVKSEQQIVTRLRIVSPGVVYNGTLTQRWGLSGLRR